MVEETAVSVFEKTMQTIAKNYGIDAIKKVLALQESGKDTIKQNIFYYYRLTGQALPFIVQRIAPKSEGSPWYVSQFIIVTKVVPNHKGYGKAYGFYYRDGERENYGDIYHKDATEPEEIYLSGTYSWNLLAIMGKPEIENTLTPESTLDFGKYKGKTIKEALPWATSASTSPPRTAGSSSP